jgi:hypothetical protein
MYHFLLKYVVDGGGSTVANRPVCSPGVAGSNLASPFMANCQFLVGLPATVQPGANLCKGRLRH